MNRLSILLFLSTFIGATPTKKVIIFGGSGFVGAQVCKHLVNAGCPVTSVSRTPLPPISCASDPWTEQVTWTKANLLSSDPVTFMGEYDAAVTCVGNIRPSPGWFGFFGLNYDSQTLEVENGLTTERAVEVAEALGVKSLTHVSIATLSIYAFYGALEGYVVGKLRGEKAVREQFPGASTIISPHLIYGGLRFPMLGKLYRANTSNGFSRGYNNFIRSIKEREMGSGFWPQDAVSELQNSPPVSVDEVSRVVAASVLGLVVPDQLTMRDVYTPDGGDLLPPPSDLVDGTDAIAEAATKWGSDNSLSQEAQALQSSSSPREYVLPPAVLPEGYKPSPTSHGAPFDGALEGAKPLLFPIPPALTVLGFFVGLITISKQNAVSGV